MHDGLLYLPPIKSRAHKFSVHSCRRIMAVGYESVRMVMREDDWQTLEKVFEENMNTLNFSSFLEDRELYRKCATGDVSLSGCYQMGNVASQIKISGKYITLK